MPVLNLVKEVANECERQGYRRVAVLGVGLTISDGLYSQSLASRSIATVALADSEVKLLDAIIYQELVHGIVKPSSTAHILAICSRLKQAGCEALIVACTELPLALNADNVPLPILDSTELLAKAAVRHALEN